MLQTPGGTHPKFLVGICHENVKNRGGGALERVERENAGLRIGLERENAGFPRGLEREMGVSGA